MSKPGWAVGRDDLTGRIVLVLWDSTGEKRHTFTTPREAAEMSDRLSEHAQDAALNAAAYRGGE